jgi:hypothetical protein
MTENFQEGCILLSRSIIGSNVFQNEKWLKVWVWCLLKANHKKQMVPITTGKGQTVVQIDRGQFIFGRHKAAESLKMNPSTVRNIMDKLEKLQNIAMQKDSHYTIVSICNYEQYQNLENYKGQSKDNQRTGKGQPKDTNKNVKNDKNVKKDIYADFPDLNIDVWVNKWLPYKKQIKSPYKTENGERNKIVQLINMSNGDKDLQAKLINQAINEEWKGIHELKGDNNGTGRQTHNSNSRQTASDRGAEILKDIYESQSNDRSIN